MSAPLATSFIDRVDERDHPIGLIQRGRVFAERAGFRTVHVFVFDEYQRLLLQRLGRNRDRHPLRWGSSVAGYLHAGETYHEAAARRLHEEIGIRTPLSSLGRTWMNDDGCHKFIWLYTTGTNGTEPMILDRGHIDELVFWKLGRLMRMLTKSPGAFTETFLHVFAYFINVRESREHGL